MRSPDCYLNVTFACAVECPDAVGHSDVCLFVFHCIYVAKPWGDHSLLSSFQRKVSVQTSLRMARQAPEHFKWLPYGI